MSDAAYADIPPPVLAPDVLKRLTPGGIFATSTRESSNAPLPVSVATRDGKLVDLPREQYDRYSGALEKGDFQGAEQILVGVGTAQPAATAPSIPAQDFGAGGQSPSDIGASATPSNGQDPTDWLYKDILGREGSGPTAISPAGAIGRGQIMPSTAAGYGVSREQLFDPAINERTSRRIISDLWNKYHDADAVRVAYNAGPGVADRWLRSGKDTSVLPGETQRYIHATPGAGGDGSNPLDEMSRAARTVRDEMMAASGRQYAAAGKMMDSVAGFEKSIPESLARIREARGIADQALAKATAATEKQPHPPEINGFAKMGSLATIVGILGGMMTSAPMTASLNAAASAIEAANKGDLDKYKLEFDAWKTNNDMLFKIADMQRTRGNDIADDEKMALSEKTTALDLYLRAVGLQNLADKMRIEGPQVWYDHQKTLEGALEKKREFDIRIQEMHERRLAAKKDSPGLEHYYEWRKSHPNATDEEDSAAYKKFQEMYPTEKAREFDANQEQHAERDRERREMFEERMQGVKEDRELRRELAELRKEEAESRRVGTKETQELRKEALQARIDETNARREDAKAKRDEERRKNPAGMDYWDKVEKYREEHKDESGNPTEPDDDWKAEQWAASNKRFPKQSSRPAKSAAKNIQITDIATGKPIAGRNTGLVYKDGDDVLRWWDNDAEVVRPENSQIVGKSVGSGALESAIPMTDDAVHLAAERSLKGDHSAVVGIGYGTVGANNRARVNNEIAAIAKERGIPAERVAAAQLEFAGRRAEIQAVGRRQALIEQAVVEAQTLAPQVLKTSEAVDRRNYSDLNAVILSAERRTGDPKVVQFGIAVNSFINTYARALSPTGTPTVSDKDHARELLTVNWSKGQIRAAMDQLNIEMNAARGATDEVWEDIIARTASGVARGPEFLKNGPSGGLPAGVPKGSRWIGTVKGKDVYEAPDLSRWSTD